MPLDFMWFSLEVKGIYLRNLIYPNIISSTQAPNLKMQIIDPNSKQIYYEATSFDNACNTNWLITGLNCQVDLNNTVNMLILRVLDADQTKNHIILETEIKFSQLKFLGNTKLSNISNLPINSVFFISELGLFTLEETWFQLQKNGVNLSPVNNSDSLVGRDIEDDEKISSLNSEIGSSMDLLKSFRSNLSDKIKEGPALENANNKLNNTGKLLLLEKLEKEYKRLDEEHKSLLQLENDQKNKLIKYMPSKEFLASCDELNKEIKALSANNKSKRDDVTRIKFLYEFRQLKLISELQSIYPIEKGENNIFLIRGLELPSDHTLLEDEYIATVLSYVVHLLVLLAKYLEIPLRYPLAYASSRSLIREPVLTAATHTMNPNLSATFPLYRKGAEREKFEKGLVLLHKNVEQIANLVGVEFNSKKCILYNLNSIFINKMCPTVQEALN